MILDIHTHSRTPNPVAIIDISDSVATSLSEWNPGTLYPDYQTFSVGIHPWNLTREMTPDWLDAVEKTALRQDVTAIGETGIDTQRGGPLYRQIDTFKKMALLAEKVEKPLIIHDVKAHDVIIGLHNDIKPKQTWIIHGFRQNPNTAEMLLRHDMYLSFGQNFNPMTLRSIPADRILAESDDSGIPIPDIIHSMSNIRGIDLTDIIIGNTARIFGR